MCFQPHCQSVIVDLMSEIRSRWRAGTVELELSKIRFTGILVSCSTLYSAGDLKEDDEYFDVLPNI
jgi:hypothetical protein